MFLRNYLNKLMFLLLACLIATSNSSAENYPAFQAKADGTTYDINLDSSYQRYSTFPVYFISTGNISSVNEIYVAGPAGLEIKVKTGFLGSSSGEVVAVSGNNTQVVKTHLGGDPKYKDSFTLTNSVTSANLYFHLQKDACSGGKSAKYIAAITLDTSKISPDLYAQGFTIRVGVKEYEYPGRMASSIKPSSDGKYKGEPILLMSSVAYGNEYVNINRWSGGKLKSTKRIPVVKYVSYKGLSLSLARLNGSLTGGKVTFELSDTGWIYGVCFQAVRKRQMANGYPM